MFSFSQQTWLGNTVMDYFFFLCILIVGFLMRQRLIMWITGLLYLTIKRHAKPVGRQKLFQLLSYPLGIFIGSVIVYMAFDCLVIPAEWHVASREQFGIRFIVYRVFHLFLIFSGFWIVLRLIDYSALIFLQRAKGTATLADDQLVSFSKEAVKVVVGVLGLFVLLGVAFQLDVVSLIAGLGIGGLAIALAAKETLENLLGSFTIFLDKPFVTGDSVRVGSIEGTVESVGFRSTRIRSTEKMLVTVPNKKMVDAELINDTNRIVRRAAFSLILNHDTTEEQIRNVVSDIRRLLSSNPVIDHNSPVVRFRNFLEKGLEVFVVYVALTSDLTEFLGIQEDVNFSIMKILKENNVVLAQPVK